MEISGTGIDVIVGGALSALDAGYQSGTKSSVNKTDLGPGAWRINFKDVSGVNVPDIRFCIGVGACGNTQKVIAYCAQVEAGSTPTSYIRTTTVPVLWTCTGFVPVF